MDLKEKLQVVAIRHDIDTQRELIIKSQNGDLCFIPIFKLFDVLTGLYQGQQQMIQKRLNKVENNVNQVMELFYHLARPIANIKL